LHSQRNTYAGVVDLVFFNGTSNVQKAGTISEKRFPRITSACAAEHTTSFFFDNFFSQIAEFDALSSFCKKLKNVIGSVRHSPTSMFKNYSKKHNKGICIGFNKSSY